MTATHPDKADVRIWQQRRLAEQRSPEHKPPPTPDEIRTQLGWALINEEFAAKEIPA